MNSKFLKLALCLGLFAGAMNNDGWSSSEENNKNNKYYNYEKYNNLDDDIINYDEQKKKAHIKMKKNAGSDKFDKYHELLSKMTTTEISANSMRGTCEKIRRELEQDEPNDRTLQRLYRVGYEQFNKADKLYQIILTNSKIVKEAQKKNTEMKISLDNQIESLNEQLSRLSLQRNIIQDIEEEHKSFMEKHEYKGMFGEYRISRQNLKKSLDDLKAHLDEQQQSNNEFFNDIKNDPRYTPKDLSMIQEPDEQLKFNKKRKDKDIHLRKKYNNELNNIAEENNLGLNDNMDNMQITKKVSEEKVDDNEFQIKQMTKSVKDTKKEDDKKDEDKKDNLKKDNNTSEHEEEEEQENKVEEEDEGGF